MGRRRIFSKLYLLFVLLALYVPMAIVVLYSFNASSSNAIWSGFTWDWYAKLFANTQLMDSLFYSIELALWSTLASVLIGTPAAVGMSRYLFRGKGLLNTLSYLPIMLPEIILGIAFLLYFSLLQLPFGMLTLVLSHVSFCIPFVMILVRTRLSDLDPSLEEAARDLGAGRGYAFFTVTLPLIAPAIVSGACLSIALSFDDVIISSFAMGMQTPLPNTIYSMLKLGMTPEINALCSLMLFAVFVVIGVLVLMRWKAQARRSG